MIKNPALKYFLKNGLKDVKDVAPQTLAQMRLAIALNFDNKNGFISAMSGAGIDKQRLELIFDNETHLSKEMGGLETASSLKMGTKVWIASGEDNCCDECKQLDGEEVPIQDNFSTGTPIAHQHVGCLCRTEYKKDEAVQEGKTYTRQDLKEMSPAQYSKARDTILEQYASGQIK